MLFNQLCLTYKLKIISRVSSITGRPNFDPLVAVEVIAIDPSPTSGLILSLEQVINNLNLELVVKNDDDA